MRGAPHGGQRPDGVGGLSYIGGPGLLGRNGLERGAAQAAARR